MEDVYRPLICQFTTKVEATVECIRYIEKRLGENWVDIYSMFQEKMQMSLKGLLLILIYHCLGECTWRAKTQFKNACHLPITHIHFHPNLPHQEFRSSGLLCRPRLTAPWEKQRHGPSNGKALVSEWEGWFKPIWSYLVGGFALVCRVLVKIASFHSKFWVPSG